MSYNCPLCSGKSAPFYTLKEREFLQCANCLSIFTSPGSYLTPEAEETHYRFHNNDPEDVRYQNFVSPLVNKIFNDFGPQHHGLDFGSGTGSPIVKMLNDKGYNIKQYDLFFHNYPQVLQQQYHYIACSETAEHFKEPHKEFSLLRHMLLPGGKLYLMTELFDENRDFATWYYKTDPTHVFLYHKNAFEWIKEEFGFNDVRIEGRVVTLES